MIKRLAAVDGAQEQVTALYEGLTPLWGQLSEAVAEIRETTGAGDLFAAVEAHAVTISDLGDSADPTVVADLLRAATGSGGPRFVDDTLMNFIARIIQISPSRDRFLSWTLSRQVSPGPSSETCRWSPQTVQFALVPK